MMTATLTAPAAAILLFCAQPAAMAGPQSRPQDARQKKPTVAVLEPSCSAGVSASLRAIVRGGLTEYVAGEGHPSPDRARLDQKTSGHVIAGLPDEKTVKGLRAALGVDLILASDLYKEGEYYNITCWLIDTATGEAKAANAYVERDTPAQVLGVTERLAAQLLGARDKGSAEPAAPLRDAAARAAREQEEAKGREAADLAAKKEAERAAAADREAAEVKAREAVKAAEAVAAMAAREMEETKAKDAAKAAETAAREQEEAKAREAAELAAKEQEEVKARSAAEANAREAAKTAARELEEAKAREAAVRLAEESTAKDAAARAAREQEEAKAREAAELAAKELEEAKVKIGRAASRGRAC
jgi:hypothetical protein